MNVNISMSFKFFAAMELFVISLRFPFDIAFDRVLQTIVRCGELGGISDRTLQFLLLIDLCNVRLSLYNVEPFSIFSTFLCPITCGEDIGGDTDAYTRRISMLDNSTLIFF
jgi:hypothetical protein